MAEKIKVTLEIDDKGGAKVIDELNDSLNDATKSSKKTAKSVEDAGEAASKSKGAFSGLGSTLKGGLGIGLVVGALDGLRDGLMENQKVQNLMNNAMVVFQGVINGVIEVLSPLFDALMKAFKNPKKAWDDLVQAFKDGYDWVYENIVENLLNRMVILANDAQIAFLKLRKAYNKFTNDTKEAAKIQKDINKLEKENRELQAENIEKNKEIVKVVKNVGDKVVKTFNTIKKATTDAFDNKEVLANAEYNIERLGILYTGIVEKYDDMAEKQRQIRDNEAKTIDERIAANEELARVLDEGEKKEKANLQSRIGLLQTQQKLLGVTKERQNEILALQQELTGVTSKYTGLRSEQQTNINALDKEAIELQRSLAEGTIEANKIIADSDAEALDGTLEAFAKRKQALEDEYKSRTELLDTELSQLKEGTQAYVDAVNEKKVLDSQYAADQKTLRDEMVMFMGEKAEEELEIERELQQGKIDAVMGGLQGLQQLLGEDSKFGKALAVTQAIINTYQGASKALGQGGIFGPIAAAGVIASGFAQVRAITQTELPTPPMGGGGGGGGTPQLAGPSVGIIGGQLDSGAQLQADIAGQMRKPARAYVVGQNVTSQQSLDRHIRQNATLGTK